MKKIITRFPNIIEINLTIFFLDLFLVQLNMDSDSIFSGIIGGVLLISLLINLFLLFILIRKKQFKKLGKNVINIVKICVVSCLVFFFLVKIEFANPLVAYIYIYIIFPYTLLVCLISAFILILKKEFKILKSFSVKLVLWILILALAIFLNKLYR